MLICKSTWAQWSAWRFCAVLAYQHESGQEKGFKPDQDLQGAEVGVEAEARRQQEVPQQPPGNQDGVGGDEADAASEGGHGVADAVHRRAPLLEGLFQLGDG